jgi:hypothetical protein
MTDLTQTIAGAAEKEAHSLNVTKDDVGYGYIYDAFTAGANLIVGMLEDSNITVENLAKTVNDLAQANTKYAEKLKTATDALESICDRRCAEGLNPCIARTALGEIGDE